MKRSAIAAVILAAAVAFGAGSWYGSSRDRTSHAVAGKAGSVLYSCPMHPRYVVGRDGNCPSCGMRLVVVNRDTFETGRPGGDDEQTVLARVCVSPEKRQILGIRTGLVEMNSGSTTLRVLGRVAVDETRIYRISAAITGRMREITPNTVGSRVRAKQRLATFYSPDFLSPQQAYLYRLDALDQIQNTGTDSHRQIALAEANVQGAADILRSLGMHDIQIEEIRKTRRLTQEIDIYSPAAGFILKRDASPGMFFEAGAEFYQIADLSRVWIQADVFEIDPHVFSPGTTATVICGPRKETYRAVVSDALPQIDPATRALKVRLEADNPEFSLNPGMFVDVELPVRYPTALTVPVDALIESGLRETAFVDLGEGYFEPRAIRTGWRTESRVEITKGLMEGERVVIGGNFMVDSESRLAGNAARGVRSRTVEDPVCGMPVDATDTGNASDYAGKTYRFCSPHCKAKFEKGPMPYL